MVPVSNTRCLLTESNRHSPRIFYKNLAKLDVSRIDNKIDFMKSLNLIFIKNKKEIYPEVEWEILTPKNKVPLKECSVIINSIVCEICRQPLKNKMDIERHKRLHSSVKENQWSNKIIIKCKNNAICCEKSDKQKFYEKYDENYSAKSADKFKFNKKYVHTKKRKNHRTQLTLKIGKEVVSTVYCKKKYLKNVTLIEDEEEVDKSNFHDKSYNNVVKCFEKENNNSNEENAQHSCIRLPKIETSDPRIARLHKMALALFEYEVRRKNRLNSSDVAYYNVEDVQQGCKAKDEENIKKYRNDDAVVPGVNADISDVDDLNEEIHQVELPHVASNNGEEVCIDSEDDCVIIDERLPARNLLTEDESSYVLHISNKNDSAEAYDNADGLTSDFYQNQNKFKKCPARSDLSSSDCNISNTQANKTKSISSRSPAIKLSQFALPLGLIDFKSTPATLLF